MAEAAARSAPAARLTRRRWLSRASAALLAAAAPARPAAAAGAPMLSHRVLAAYPHDPEAFTQGLLVQAGVMYESTGLRGRSSLRRVDVETGRVLASRALPDWAFGEGLAAVGDELLQLTWQSGIAFRWRRQDFAPRGRRRYRGEGWGLATDGERLVMSNGSEWLSWRDPGSFAELGRVRVTDAGEPVAMLNELEFAGGALWANVWRSSRIARIDPASGRVSGWLHLADLPGPMFSGRRVDVLNGIAWDASARRFYVTGKLWPRLFQLEVEGLNTAA